MKRNYKLALENINYHKSRCIGILNLQRGANTKEGVYGEVEANIDRDLTNTSLGNTNMELIKLMHTRELRCIENFGTVIMGGGLEGNFFVISKSVGDS